ncbi:MAG: ATPase domain-containing protein [Thermoplasmatota archaeon]
MGRKSTKNKSKKGRQSRSKSRRKAKEKDEPQEEIEEQLVEEAEEEVLEEEKEEPQEEVIEKPSRRRGKKVVVVEEEEEKEDETVEEEPGEATDNERSEGEEVWEAVVWEDIMPTHGPGPVFDDPSMQEVLKDVIDEAWTDGKITDDEMAMLRVLKKKLKIDDETFDRIISESKPRKEEGGAIMLEPLDLDPGELPEPEIVLDEEEDEDDEEEEEAIEEVEGEEEEEELDRDLVPDTLPPSLIPSDLPQPPPRPEILDRPEPLTQPEPEVQMPPEPRPKVQETRNIITFTSHVRDNKKPLDESFDLTKRDQGASGIKRRCPHCRAMIMVRPEEGRDTCPICGGKVIKDKLETPGLRRLLDQGKSAYKDGDVAAAAELYKLVLVQSPENKEAQFYLQKMQHQTIDRRPIAKGDARNIAFIQTTITRLDQLLHGGIPSSSQVLLKGPAFSGKEVVFDKIMAASLSNGIPVIYVSSNRAMKEVMRGIIRQVPDFKRYNQEGLVRMYDLFSKHSDGKILKEGHRIFNIEDREDFKRFQSDIVFMMEELVQQYHGGVLLINSLSPLINQVELNDLMKFLQVVIARSKSYRFTNILDMAAGVHTETVENSIEYLMDGIIEFKELEHRKSLRLKGFRHGVLTRDWIDYKHSDSDMQLVGSFQEERII